MGFASFPRGPDEPGVYLVKLTACGTYRIYIGEAANLRKRLRSYGGTELSVLLNEARRQPI
jgi:excinuclease UvrABC nuclease subunit